MSLTIKTEFVRSNGEVEIRRTRLIDGSDRHVQLLKFLDSIYGTNQSYVLSYVDPDGDLCSINSDAELLECCRCATETGKTAKVQVKVEDSINRSTSQVDLSRASSQASNVSVPVSNQPTSQSVDAEAINQPISQPVDVDSDSEYVQVDTSRPATPSARFQVINESVSQPINQSVTVEDVTAEDAEENALVQAIMASLAPEKVEEKVETPAVDANQATSQANGSNVVPSVKVETPADVNQATSQANVVPSVFTTVTSNVTEVKKDEVKKDEASKVDAPTQSNTQSTQSTQSTSQSTAASHHGIICDGCQASPITGDRYKCAVCVDFDLCSKCEQSGKSFGRHSAQHDMIKFAAPPVIHGGIVCDGCQASPIVGDRYKCTICVDFDLCSKCKQSGTSIGRHSAQHNMIKIGEARYRPCGPCPVFNQSSNQSSSQASEPSDVHAGVRCDGCGVAPIRGIRYKCTACPNFDLCEKCEAKNEHDPKHVLLKMRHQVTGEDVQNAILNRVSHWWRRPHGHHGFAHHGGHHGPRHGGMFGGGRWGHCGRNREDPTRPRASFVGDVTVQDGAIVAPGSKFQKVWSVQNTGDKAWPEGCKLIFVGGDLTSADQSGTPVEHSVSSVAVSAQPGETVNIKIDITAPTEEGRFRSTFRLVDANGEKFGPRMWIDVNVQNLQSAADASTASPRAAASGAESSSSGDAEQDPVRTAIENFLASLGQQGGSSPLNSLLASLGQNGGLEKLLSGLGKQNGGTSLLGLLGALGQNGGGASLQSILDLMQGGPRAPSAAAPAPSAPTESAAATPAFSIPVAAPVVSALAEPFRFQAELDSIREMQVDADDETLKRLLTRYNGSVPRTVAQIFEM